ncbi:hypothetical protein G9C85_05745 [Halorubellus sp. JP-L1]|uniref:hypothetical protein n=1 Tax=Halorubellus sp. JP-L1 TaxID=2715753 RepID=UPI00140D3004|nr:hypothetical protein [Halorubellus sp. JP-L1]NHN41138.1 hypothetical protein [Halorubellus sp. JP-L1]
MVQSTDEPPSNDEPSWRTVASPVSPADGLDRVVAAVGRGRDAFPTTRVRHGVFGRRTTVSVALIALAFALAVAAAQHVAATVGYGTVGSWVHGTWTGTNPEPLLFLGVAALLALATASAAGNSGLVPTVVLVAGPVYGVAFARYGTRETLSRYGPEVVSLPEAAAFAAFVAIAVAVPVAVLGFGLGSGVRHALAPLRR